MLRRVIYPGRRLCRISDYGSLDDPMRCRTLLAYAALQNLKPGVTCPPILITAVDYDDSVLPADSFKFAAQLQADQPGNAPLLIRIESKADHGVGKPTTKIVEEAADRYAFLARVLGVGDEAQVAHGHRVA